MKNQIFKFIPLLVLLAPFLNSQAQTVSSTEGDGHNMVKFNAMSLLGGKFAFEYERMLTSRIAAGAAVSIRPNKGLPFGSTVKSFADDEELDQLIDDFSSSNFSITPEIRFYTS